MDPNQHRARVEAFRQLHARDCFLLPNPWDAGSAVILASLGFKALASTSAGVSFAQALPDTVDGIGLAGTLENLRTLVDATSLPVNADFQTAYASSPEQVEQNVAACVQTGVAGLSIEDASGEGPNRLFDPSDAIARVRAARRAIDASGLPVVLTGRCEGWLIGADEPEASLLDRLVAYAEAGADCLYAPGVVDPQRIETILRAVSPRPVNVLMSSPKSGMTFAALADLGVRRISVGSALARVAWGAFLRSARALAEHQDFEALGDAAPFSELNAIFETSRR